MLCIIGFWVNISKISTLEDTKFHYFIADSAVFWYFHPRYLTNGNSKTYERHQYQWAIFFIFAFQDLQNSVPCLLTWISFFYIKFANFEYITCSVPNLIPTWSWSHGLKWKTEYSKSNNIWNMSLYNSNIVWFWIFCLS